MAPRRRAPTTPATAACSPSLRGRLQDDRRQRARGRDDEENETLKVLLSNQIGVPAVNLIDAQGDGTIIDKNAPPTLSISDTLGREGEGATFTVTLAGTTLRTVTVNFNTADATAKAGSDYAARSGALSFAPGETTKTITVTILDDNEAEPVEEFFVNIGDVVNGAITKNRGEGSIEASDRPDTPPTTTRPARRRPPRSPHPCSCRG